MTAPVDEVEKTAPPAEPSAPPSGGGRYRGRYRAKPSPWWSWGFPVCLALAVLSIPVLVFVGMRVVLTSSDGRLIRTIDDPAAPGWQAIVEPTPIQALALVDAQGALDSVSVLVLTGDGSGSIIEVPGTVMATVAGAPVTLAGAYAAQGVEGMRPVLEAALGVGVPDIDLVNPSRWADLVAPVGPLQVDNPDPVLAADGSVVFPTGRIELPASSVWEYLGTRGENETDLAQLARREAFWRAWLREISEDPSRPGVLPGEVDVGLGRFVRALAADSVTVTVLPVSPSGAEGATPGYVPIMEDVAQLVARAVPFPAGPEGVRIRIVVLDGTGDLDHGLSVAVALGAAGGQVDKVGNHVDFGVATTQLIFYDEAMRPSVERLRELLGVGQVVLMEEPGAAAGVTVILGQDYVDATGS